MNCPHCNAQVADDARFCGECGRATTGTAPASETGLPAVGEQPDLVGREIAGRYRILAKLGEGGMGAVYRAEQISLKRTVAVKLLRPEVAGSQLLLRRFNAEAEAVAKLSHPNTVNIYDFGQDTDGTLFIAMEFIDGKSLRSVVQREAPLPLRRALSIAQQIAASLTDAHAHSIVHRDLKPDNVMLQERGRQRDVVRVLDFGIAKLRDENRQTAMAMTQQGDMLGTPQYMAPEQIRAEHIDGRTDVYALGCMLYELITARLPYEGPTVMALLSKHLLENAPPPSQRRPDLLIPPAVDNLIMLAMAKDPNARPATMELFGEQIAELLAALPVDSQASTGIRPSPFLPPNAPGPYGTMPTGIPGTPMPMPPGPFVPTPSGYVPRGPGAAPYDPHAQHFAPPPAQPAKSSKAALWIVLVVLLLGGGAAGAYFGFMRDDGKPVATAGPGSAGSGSAIVETPRPPPPPVTPDAATGTADPWSGGTSPSVPVAADEPDALDEPDAPDAPDAPTKQVKRPAAGKLTPACEEYVGIMERYAGCADKMLAGETLQQLRSQIKQMRSSFLMMQQQGTPQMMQQIEASCRQGADGMRQALTSMGCK